MFGIEKVVKELAGIRQAILTVIPEIPISITPNSSPRSIMGIQSASVHVSLHNFRRDILLGKGVCGERQLREKMTEIFLILGVTEEK